ncbi:T9SS type A sorting domain-containing protein [Flavobacterium sp. GT3P67]|uniref:T9SS type A sorting domain-containing protein n=1 Tax=Flavobacterium sp. GT3P67 TaxID=2541722 RepID=UPI00104B2029|nr:T9SS type A sorting domain-containing protein [Flavobacterium sp. GT3P67]TDE52697.1 T9SS type A sorting domain-containing protein [Flavobacterium sp. GT3P67]
MKKIIYIMLLLSVTFSKAQNNKITFDYDAAGNQIKRDLCLNCTNANYKTTNSKEVTALKEEDLQKFFPEDVISYYPNPVKEELYLKWELIEGNLVTSIQVYGLSGQLLKSYSGLEKNNAQNIPFQTYPSGTYLIVLSYTYGEQKNIKIIKQ